MTSGRLATAALGFLAAFSSQPAMAQEGAACPLFRWTTLGTAGGPIATLDRSEPANLLDAGNVSILVDTGDGTAIQLARMDRNLGEIEAVFISHLHWDHVGGLAAVLGLRWMNQYPGEVAVYGPPGIRAVVDGIVASLRPQERVGFGTGAAVPDPGANITIVELVDGQQVEFEGLRATARTNTHFDFPLEEIGTTSLGFRFDVGDRSITYSGDTGPSAELTGLAQGTDMLVTEVIALEPLIADILVLRNDMSPEVQAAMRKHLSTHHIDATEVERMAAAADVGRVVLTHFAIPPAPLRSSETYLRDGVRQHYSGPLDLARDLSSFDLGCE